MKARACRGKANRKNKKKTKNFRNILQKTENLKKKKKVYKSASYPAAVSETPVHLRQHHTTDQHQGRRFGVVFLISWKGFQQCRM